MALDDECASVSCKSWARSMQVINKVGYMDGAADGQSAAFQSSFDVGYKQGFEFGLQLGYSEASLSVLKKQHPATYQLSDQRRINCQICLDKVTADNNLMNLYNIQKEANDCISHL